MEELSILTSFKLFKLTLNKLLNHLTDDLTHLPVWISTENHEELNANRTQLQAALSLLAPQNETPQETFSCPGVVACTSHTIDLIEQLNQIKSDFKAKVQLYLKEKNSKDTRLIRDLLKYNGHNIVKLKHVYRHLKYLDYHPRRFALGLSRSSSHRIISIDHAKKMLNQAGQGKHIDIQLNQLFQLQKTTSLVILRKIPAHWIANVSTFKNAEGESITKKIKSSLPIFYLHDPNQELPIVEFANKRTSDAQRSDKKLEVEPFLPSISAYKYAE